MLRGAVNFPKDDVEAGFVDPFTDNAFDFNNRDISVRDTGPGIASHRTRLDNEFPFAGLRSHAMDSILW